MTDDQLAKLKNLVRFASSTVPADTVDELLDQLEAKLVDNIRAYGNLSVKQARDAVHAETALGKISLLSDELRAVLAKYVTSTSS